MKVHATDYRHIAHYYHIYNDNINLYPTKTETLMVGLI